jgi:hypothetical protein
MIFVGQKGGCYERIQGTGANHVVPGHECLPQLSGKNYLFGGNFRVVFPETPQQQKGAERNLHRFSAAAGDESYGVTYADYPRARIGKAW